MANEIIDKEQTKRIDKLEQEVITLRIQFAELISRIETLTNIGKVLAIVAGTAVGIDVIPMIN